jgi:hypothetical protein
MLSTNIKFLETNLHWQKAGWRFDELMQLRSELRDLDPFLNCGTREIQAEVGGLMLPIEDKTEFRQLKFVIVDDDDFDGNPEFFRLCPNLEQLFICGISAAKKIADLSPLAGLKKLKYLHLEYHNIKDLAPLLQHKDLEELYLSENPLQDISGILELENLQKMNLPEAEEEDIFKLLQNSPSCKAHFINREFNRGFDACLLGDWAYMYRYFKGYDYVETDICPLLRKNYTWSPESEELMKNKLQHYSRSVLRADEEAGEEEFECSRKPVAVSGKLYYTKAKKRK